MENIYTMPRLLIYKDRRKLTDFGINEEKSINYHVCKWLSSQSVIAGEKEKEKTLSCLNNAYYICTLILAGDLPSKLTDKYLAIASKPSCPDYGNIYNGAPHYKVLTILLANFFSNHISGLTDEQKHAFEMLTAAVQHESPNAYNEFAETLNEVAKKIKISAGEFQPRVIDENAINDLNYSGFRWAKVTDNYNKEILDDIIEGLGKNNDEKLELIEMFLQDIDIHYGDNSSYKDTITFWLRTRENDIISSLNPEELKKWERLKQNPTSPERILSKCERVKEENKRWRELDERKGKGIELLDIPANGELITFHKGWIACFDGFLKKQYNPKKFAEALQEINMPSLPRTLRPYWAIFYRVLSENGCLSENQNQSLLLKWANLHFNLGWDWRKSELFKFSRVKRDILDYSISSWPLKIEGSKKQDYIELAKKMTERFFDTSKRQLIAKSEFLRNPEDA